jgi:glycosyltransferase involved in cell wall biosynthesis
VRLAWLIQGFNHNLDCCLRAFSELGNDQLVIYQGAMRNTAFDGSGYLDYAETLIWQEPPTADQVIVLLREFRPDAVVMSGWRWPPSYRNAMKTLAPGVLRILAMDNTWQGTPKQWLGRAVHRFYIDPMFDCAIVPSDRAEWFARRLGFPPAAIIRGLYTADTALFDRGPRSGNELAAAGSFVFTGRLVRDKAVDVLADAYRHYRASAPQPWRLQVAGAGELGGPLAAIPGVTMHGFRQPHELAELLHTSSCLVLPSRFEPYGVVVHEAAAAGLPLLVSDVAAATPGLLQDGFNGWIVPSGDAALWAAAMTRVSSASAERLEEMSRGSHALSSRLSVPGWARNLHEEISRQLATPPTGPRAPGRTGEGLAPPASR